MKKYLLAIFVLAVLVTPNFVPASAITKDELQQQISLLLAQIKVMQAQLDEMQGFKEPEWCYNFKNNLKIGDSGSDVAALQTALVKEGFSIEGDEVSSNFPARFNEATASAVTGFQQKYEKEILAPWGLKYGTGYVGRTTIKKLNELYGCGISLPRPTPPIPIPVPTIWPVPSPEPIPFPSPVKQPHYDAGPNTIIRGQQNYLNAVVKSSHVETPIFFYLQRPDGTMKYNAYEAGTTDAKGNFIKSFYERVDNEGQNGTWVSWVAVGGALSNKVYHKVIEKPTIVPIPPTPTPSITVLSPNGGEVWTVGKNHQIQFKIAESESGYADLLIFSENNESTYVFNDFFENKKLSAGIYTSNWTIPQNVLTGKYIAKVYLKTLPVEGKVLSTDISDQPFSIVAASGGGGGGGSTLTY